jgi:predicted transcriptional regulator
MKSWWPEVAMIRHLRKKSSMTQKELAQLSGVPQSVISRIEDRKIHEPSYRVVSKIFVALESTPKTNESTISASDVMNRKIVSVQPDDKVSKAWFLMKENDYSQLPVIDERSRIKGGITIQAIPDQQSEMASSMELLVRDVMIESFPIVGKDARLATISAILRLEPAVLVVEKGTAVGIITKYDLVDNVFSSAGNLLK